MRDALTLDHDHDIDVLDYFKPQWYDEEAVPDSSEDEAFDRYTDLAEDRLAYGKETDGYMPNMTWWVLNVEPFGSSLRLYRSAEYGEDEGGGGVPDRHSWMLLREGHLWALVPHAPPTDLRNEANKEGRHSQFVEEEGLHVEDLAYELYAEYGSPSLERDMFGWRRRLEQAAGADGYALADSD